DGRTILFLTRGRDVPELQINLLANGSDARELTHHATPVSAPAWSADGSTIYFLANDPRTAAERERDRLRDDIFSFEENLKPRHLWRVNVSTGAETRLTDGDFSITAFRISGDGHRIALHRAPTTLESDTVRSEVWVMDAN